MKISLPKILLRYSNSGKSKQNNVKVILYKMHIAHTYPKRHGYKIVPLVQVFGLSLVAKLVQYSTIYS